jgi:hypothetical protein
LQLQRRETKGHYWRTQSIACLFSLFIPGIQTGDVAVKIRKIMLLPATRSDDEGEEAQLPSVRLA